MSDPAPADLVERVGAARDRVLRDIGVTPHIGLILGSGLGAMGDTLEDPERIDYEAIPGWPSSTVEGHAGCLVVGRCRGVAVAVMQGRVHLYEGYPAWTVGFPTRVLAAIGCEALIVTNAAGAIDTRFQAGELMLITDHLNLQGDNPCRGPNADALGLRFFDMSTAYDPEYRDVVRAAAGGLGVELREGVYVALLGPSYETPAEIRMLRALGADAVGMSTVPEVIVANQSGLRVVGISCLSNMAAGILDAPLDHREVMESAERARGDLLALLEATVEGIASLEGWLPARGDAAELSGAAEDE